MEGSRFLRELSSYLPSWAQGQGLMGTLVGVFLILAAGFVCALLGRAIASHAAGRLASQLTRWGQVEGTESHARLRKATGATIYWAILVISFMAAAEVAGLPIVTEWLGRTAAYFPRVISAVLIVGFGLLGAKLIGQLVARAARSAKLPGTQQIQRTTEVAVVFACIVVAVEQVGIEISFLKSFVLIIFAAALGGAAFAFGLGSRDVIADVLSVHFLRRHYREGQRVRVGEFEGTILHIRETSVVLENDEGQLFIPGHKLSRETSVLLTKGGVK